MAVETVPAGHPALPIIATERGDDLFRFLEIAFEAQLVDRYELPDGKPMYLTVRVGDSTLSVMQPVPEVGPTHSAFYVYVPDVDSVYRRALDAGARSIGEPAPQVHGDRVATFVDLLGNQWTVATRTEEISVEEMHRRADEAQAAS